MSRISNDLNQIAEVAHHAPEDLLISLVLIVRYRL
jgi:ATP-binding cassette subfamily B protein